MKEGQPGHSQRMNEATAFAYHFLSSNHFPFSIFHFSFFIFHLSLPEKRRWLLNLLEIAGCKEIAVCRWTRRYGSQAMRNEK